MGVGEASPSEIDELNFLEATFLAMRRAISSLPGGPRSMPWSTEIDCLSVFRGRQPS